jgi:hypothetical protein
VATRHDSMSRRLLPTSRPAARCSAGGSSWREHRGRPCTQLARLPMARRRRTGFEPAPREAARQSRLDGGAPVRDAVDRVRVCA